MDQFNYYTTLFSSKSWKVKSFVIKPLTLGNFIAFELFQVKGFCYDNRTNITRSDIINFLIITSRDYVSLMTLTPFKRKLLKWKYNRLLNKDVKKEFGVVNDDSISKYLTGFLKQVDDYFKYYIENLPTVIQEIENGRSQIEKKTIDIVTPQPIALFYKFNKLFPQIPMNQVFDIPYCTIATWDLIDLEMKGCLKMNNLESSENKEFWDAIEEAEKNPEEFKKKFDK